MKAVEIGIVGGLIFGSIPGSQAIMIPVLFLITIISMCTSKFPEVLAMTLTVIMMASLMEAIFNDTISRFIANLTTPPWFAAAVPPVGWILSVFQS